MNQSEKSNRVVFRLALYAVLCAAILLFVVESRTQAQSLMTRHVREANLKWAGKIRRPAPSRTVHANRRRSASSQSG